jgi:hypothetical protein
MNATEIDFLAALTVGGSNAGSFTMSVGAYTMSGSTASLASSASGSYGWALGSTTTAASIFGGNSGTRWRSVPLATWNLTPGEYMFGVMFSSASVGGGSSGAYSLYGQSAVSIVGAIGGGNQSHTFGDGLYSTTATSFPATIQLSQIVQTGALALQQPSFIVYGT